MLVAPSREAAARGPAASAAEAASDRAVRAAPPRVVTWVRAVSGRAVSRLRRVGPARAEQPEAAAAEAMWEQVGRGAGGWDPEVAQQAAEACCRAEGPGAVPALALAAARARRVSPERASLTRAA